MADQKRDSKNNPSSGKKSSEKNDSEHVGKGKENDNEWLRDQVGEDHNLSGSTTFRTLPDQPEPGTEVEDLPSPKPEKGKKKSR